MIGSGVVRPTDSAWLVKDNGTDNPTARLRSECEPARMRQIPTASSVKVFFSQQEPPPFAASIVWLVAAYVSYSPLRHLL